MIDVKALMAQLKEEGGGVKAAAAVDVEAVTEQVDLLAKQVKDAVDNIVVAHEPKPMEKAENKPRNVIKITKGIEFLEGKKQGIEIGGKSSPRPSSAPSESSTKAPLDKQHASNFQGFTNISIKPINVKEALDFVIEAAKKETDHIHTIEQANSAATLASPNMIGIIA